MKKKNRKKIFILLAIVIVVGVLIVVNSNKNKIKTTDVETQILKRDRIVQTVNASGSLIPAVQVKQSAKVSGRIINITIKEGDNVEKGQLLVELDRETYEAMHDRSYSSLQSAKANYKKIKSDLKRTRALYKNQLISIAELEAAVASEEMAASQVKQAQAALKQTADDLEKTKLIAQMSGTITRLNKKVGEMAVGSTFQQDVILIISDMSKMEVKVDIDETDVVDISIGDTAVIEIDALPDTDFRGIVSEIAHSASILGQGTQEQVTNFEIKITVLGQDKRFRPGMSSTVDVITDIREDAVVLPIQALTVRPPLKDSTETIGNENEVSSGGSILDNEDVEVVFIVKHPAENSEAKKGLFAQKPSTTVEQLSVKVGISSDTHFEVVEGLDEGAEVVIGSYKVISNELKHNNHVNITNKEKEKGNLQ